MTNKPHDPVNSPKGYNSHPSGIETVEVTEHFTAMLGSAVKYVWRRKLKGNEIQDLQKAAWCFRREAQRIRLRLGVANLWDGDFWRGPAVLVMKQDDTILGDILSALLMMAGVDARAIDLLAERCDDEVSRLQFDEQQKATPS